MTLYALLDVPEDASAEEIKRAYRDAARACHPDANPGAEPGRFARVSEAHETLSDETKRATYDSALRLERRAKISETPASSSWSGFETYANDFRDRNRSSSESAHGGYYGESDLKRRERLARARAEDAAAAAAWWRREKASSAAARVRFRAHAARAEGRRADRAGEKLKSAGWVVRRGATRADVAVTAACAAFVAVAGVAFFGREPKNGAEIHRFRK
jgi:curved DNA-binding protein CbpA